MSKIDLQVQTLSGKYFNIKASENETVLSLKNKILIKQNVPISQQHLIHNSCELDNNLTLQEYGITQGSTLKLVLHLKGGPMLIKKVSLYKDASNIIKKANLLEALIEKQYWEESLPLENKYVDKEIAKSNETLSKNQYSLIESNAKICDSPAKSPTKSLSLKNLPNYLVKNNFQIENNNPTIYNTNCNDLSENSQPKVIKKIKNRWLCYTTYDNDLQGDLVPTKISSSHSYSNNNDLKFLICDNNMKPVDQPYVHLKVIPIENNFDLSLHTFHEVLTNYGLKSVTSINDQNQNLKTASNPVATDFSLSSQSRIGPGSYKQVSAFRIVKKLPLSTTTTNVKIDKLNKHLHITTINHIRHNSSKSLITCNDETIMGDKSSESYQTLDNNQLALEYPMSGTAQRNTYSKCHLLHYSNLDEPSSAFSEQPNASSLGLSEPLPHPPNKPSYVLTEDEKSEIGRIARENFVTMTKMNSLRQQLENLKLKKPKKRLNICHSYARNSGGNSFDDSVDIGGSGGCSPRFPIFTGTIRTKNRNLKRFDSMTPTTTTDLDDWDEDEEVGELSSCDDTAPRKEGKLTDNAMGEQNINTTNLISKPPSQTSFTPADQDSEISGTKSVQEGGLSHLVHKIMDGIIVDILTQIIEENAANLTPDPSVPTIPTFLKTGLNNSTSCKKDINDIVDSYADALLKTITISRKIDSPPPHHNNNNTSYKLKAATDIKSAEGSLHYNRHNTANLLNDNSLRNGATNKVYPLQLRTSRKIHNFQHGRSTVRYRNNWYGCIPLSSEYEDISDITDSATNALTTSSAANSATSSTSNSGTDDETDHANETTYPLNSSAHPSPANTTTNSSNNKNPNNSPQRPFSPTHETSKTNHGGSYQLKLLNSATQKLQLQTGSASYQTTEPCTFNRPANSTSSKSHRSGPTFIHKKSVSFVEPYSSNVTALASLHHPPTRIKSTHLLSPTKNGVGNSCNKTFTRKQATTFMPSSSMDKSMPPTRLPYHQDKKGRYNRYNVNGSSYYRRNSCASQQQTHASLLSECNGSSSNSSNNNKGSSPTTCSSSQLIVPYYVSQQSWQYVKPPFNPRETYPSNNTATNVYPSARALQIYFGRSGPPQYPARRSHFTGLKGNSNTDLSGKETDTSEYQPSNYKSQWQYNHGNTYSSNYPTHQGSRFPVCLLSRKDPENYIPPPPLSIRSTGLDVQVTNHRCDMCTKKIGISSSYLCRCDKEFCVTHRYPEMHACKFDYKLHGRKIMELSNPKLSPKSRHRMHNL